MKNSIEKGNIIKRIREGIDLDVIAAFARNRILKKGPSETLVLEILSYLKLFQPDYFSLFECEMIETMGLFFKQPVPDSLQGAVFDIYRQHIKEEYGEDFTPMQADILKQINSVQFFSFSAPTSTGKSFVFRHIIKTSTNDVVVVVPSRALINEYFDRTKELVNIKEVNILTFVDRINTKHSIRNIFILTPERARELFKNKYWLRISTILFDEAQLSDDNSIRGLYFDSIVRRSIKAFPDSKIVFAHPFVSNPEAQLIKNNIVDTSASYNNYQLKNVGQIFYVYDTVKNEFYHFGTNKDYLGKQRIKSTFDPIEKAILHGGSVLIYVSKSHIYDKSIYKQFDKYIKLCTPIHDPDGLEMINQLGSYIGASNKDSNYYNSEMLEKLSLGIVTHHGSMPLTARLILEHFTQRGFCRICFATSTLEQGINMPFDVVYLDKFEASRPLSVKNLIGRAGRSTTNKEFDYGSVIIRPNAMTSFRDVINKQNPLSSTSKLDIQDETIDEKYNEFKDAIKNDEYSDEYNLTNSDVEKLHTDEVTAMIPTLLDIMFDENDNLIKPENNMKEVYDLFGKLYEQYLGRELTKSEKGVLSSAIKIMIWKVYGKTFHSICRSRYAYTSRVTERRKLNRKGDIEGLENLKAKYLVGCHDIPDKKLRAYPLISPELPAKDVDYDLIVYDTYDYLDKIIGFKLSDIFYAIFHQYYISQKDDKALRLAKYFKYGTDNEREIWMLRYGLSFEDIEWANDCIEQIDANEIVFNKKVYSLSNAHYKVIEPYVYE
ncbi:MAG: DEAD/DEAH box helicase [Ruminococcus sp.]|nr:DEAD/DEAH box helicase [Ruminococcus sp.]